MIKLVSKIIAVSSFCVSVMFVSSCGKEDEVEDARLDKNVAVYSNGIDEISGDTIIVRNDFQSLSKGYLFKHSNRIEYATAYHQIDSKIQYKVMKIRRRNSEKYFYVMVTNLDFKTGKECWAYEDNPKNVDKYGRLYSWTTANRIASEFYMILPVYENGVVVDSMETFGRLLCMEDVLDIIGCDNLGNLPENGHRLTGRKPLSKNLYFDTFISGAEPVNNITDINILAGTRNHRKVNGRYYNYMNEQGFILLSDGMPQTPDFHHYLWFEPIKTDSRIVDYTMFSNSMCPDADGGSVRLVFEPEYIE